MWKKGRSARWIRRIPLLAVAMTSLDFVGPLTPRASTSKGQVKVKGSPLQTRLVHHSRCGVPINFESMGIDALGEDAVTFLFASVLVYPTCRQLSLSPLLGFLLAGLLLRQLNLFQESRDEMALADFGVLCLLFQIGLELTVDRLQRLGRFAIRLGLPALLLSTAILAVLELPPGKGFGTQILMVLGGADPNLVSVTSFVEATVLGLGLSLSSSAFVLQLLREKGETESKVANAVVGVLLLQDIAVVPLLALLPVVQMLQDPGNAATADSGEGLLVLATGGIKGLLLLSLVFLISKFVAKPLLSNTAATFGGQSDALTAGVILTIAVASISTKAIGLSDSLGAFLIGTLLADSSQKERIEEAILPFKGLLLGLFFLTVGASLDVGLLIQDWRSIGLLLLGVTVVKALTFIAAGRALAGLSWPESVRVGLLLAQGGEFAFVVFQLADDLQILPDSLNRYLLIVIVLSIALTPFLDSIGVAIASRLEAAGTKVNSRRPIAKLPLVGAEPSPGSVEAPTSQNDDDADEPDGVRFPVGSLPLSKEIFIFQAQPLAEFLDALLVGLGCLVFALRTLPDLNASSYDALLKFEDVISALFLFDYLLRWWARGLQVNYLLSLPMVLNFVTFLPFLLKVLMPQSAELDLNFLRLLRVLSIYRFLRTEEFERISKLLPAAVRSVRPWQLAAARVFGNIFTLTFIVAGVVYDAEHTVNPQFSSFFDAFYFTTTSLSTLGLGDIVPITPLGRAVTSIAVLLALGIIPIQLSGVAQALSNDGGFEELFSDGKKSKSDRRRM